MTKTENKSPEYYNEYCRSVDGFSLITQFQDLGDFYEGNISAIGTVHPLLIRVQIPKSFPHNKLHFYTNSLWGYPHLIYIPKEGTSWFCLNSPFAETAEAQLDEEFERLRQWIRDQMKPELPAYITGPVVSALGMFNAYEGENVDEIRELQCKTSLVFIGDFCNNASNFRNSGVLYCIRSYADRLFAFERRFDGAQLIPYILVDEDPTDKSDFLKLKKEFHWDDETCEKLLPGFGFDKTKQKFDIAIGKEAYEILKQTPTSQEDAFQQDDIEYEIYKLYYFALGVKNSNRIIKWYIFDSCLKATIGSLNGKIMKNDFLPIESLTSLGLAYSLAKSLNYNEYFGRGLLTPAITDTRIGIVGLGAIGSHLAEELARGGVKEIELWDRDIVEPGNLCRSTYSREDIGEIKLEQVAAKIDSISPFCRITKHGYYQSDQFYNKEYIGGDLYGRINYKNQEDVQNEIANCKLMIDCTASNELLHFLSYSYKDMPLISLCITNKARELMLISNHDGNPYELRKVYLSKIEQDTENFYVENTGCYSPTFLASNCDVQSLTMLALRYINRQMQQNNCVASCFWTYREDSIIADPLIRYRVHGTDIQLYITKQTLEQASCLPICDDGSIGFLLGGVSTDGHQVMITHIIGKEDAENQLSQIFVKSDKVIDYLGDFNISSIEPGKCREEFQNQVISKAQNPHININNPILALLNPESTLSFYLYIDGKFLPCERCNT